MARSEEKFHKRRLRSSYLSVIISITLVLFMLGTFGTVVLKSDEITRGLLEDYAFTVMLKNDAPEADVRQLQKELELSDKVVSTEFVPKEEAAIELQESIGEDFVDFLNYNPLSDAIVVKMQYNFVNTDDVEAFKDDLLQSGLIIDVAYDPNVLDIVNANIRRISTGLLIGAVLLILISIALINSSIRLSIYSKRFTIKTMQLVGATKTFIQKPFMRQSAQLGIFGGVLASIMLGGIFYFGRDAIAAMNLNIDLPFALMIFGGMIVFGSFLAWSCTFVAVKRYLKLKTDELYY